VDKGTPLGGLEFEDNAEPSHGLHTVLSSLWGQGRLAHRLRIRFPEDEGVRRPKRLGTWPYYTRRGTSSPCDATTPEGFGPETSKQATWCFGCDKTPEGGTSSRLPGKGRSHRQGFEA
jgi:hypothetical protein